MGDSQKRTPIVKQEARTHTRSVTANGIKAMNKSDANSNKNDQASDSIQERPDRSMPPADEHIAIIRKIQVDSNYVMTHLSKQAGIDINSLKRPEVHRSLVIKDGILQKGRIREIKPGSFNIAVGLESDEIFYIALLYNSEHRIFTHCLVTV